ncbi:thioredoxin domain-containing protein [Megavirus courdo7]|uniref:Thioredoxin domain-containing protein n=1 Tax=Megavirus courdo7 TaxID=1128135 RepID=H2EB07_9VIRU|nr:thioredoxin domain-containing protein [Megavirus courdo7]
MRNLSWQHILIIIIIIIIIFWLVSWLFFPKNINVPTGSYYPVQPQLIQPMTIITPNLGQNMTGNQLPRNNVVPTINPVNTESQPSNTQDPFMLYYFHAPSCVHCRNFNPAWEMLRERLAGSRGISTAKVDATKPENENLVFYYNVSAFPTIILITPDQNVEYNGNRTPDDLHNFVVAHINEHNNRVSK